MSPLSKKIVIILSLVVIAFVATGYLRARSNDEKAYRALTVYSEVLDKVQNDYVDDPNMAQVTNGALHGLLDSLDSESAYLSPLEYKDYKEKSATKATGETGLVLIRRGYIGVLGTLADTPAAKAGLRIGDIIEKIAGFSTGQMAIGQAELLLRGAPGTVVKISVIRRGKTEPQDLDLTLEKLPAPKLLEDKLQGDIAYLRVPTFEAGMTKQIRERLVQFQHQGIKKLILDLRDCPSGEVQEGIATAQLFVPSGTITTLKGQTVNPIVSTAEPSKVVWTDPVSVLIGIGTAGPAEIVAGAISGNHRGETVGDRTYGTASMQKLIEMDDGSAMILTVANYYTPDNKEIPANGVAATAEVHPSLDEVIAANDQKQPVPSEKPVSVDDPVIKKAIEVLQGTATSARKAA
jgi:carboxyl-terminal processing protease